jgi:hypothetical protein
MVWTGPKGGVREEQASSKRAARKEQGRRSNERARKEYGKSKKEQGSS